MIIKKCLVCGKKFKIFLCRQEKRKFCSRKCKIQNQIGKPTWNKGTKGLVKSNFGSFKKGHPKPKNAYTLSSGKKNIFWKGGKRKEHNRWLIYSPNHLFSNSKKCVFQSRLVAEKCLGRYLTKQEIIHHINGNTLNDKPENLYLFSSNSEHMKYEGKKNKPPLKSNLL